MSVTIEGKTYTSATALAKELGMAHSTVNRRIKNGATTLSEIKTGNISAKPSKSLAKSKTSTTTTTKQAPKPTSTTTTTATTSTTTTTKRALTPAEQIKAYHDKAEKTKASVEAKKRYEADLKDRAEKILPRELVRIMLSKITVKPIISSILGSVEEAADEGITQISWNLKDDSLYKRSANPAKIKDDAFSVLLDSYVKVYGNNLERIVNLANSEYRQYATDKDTKLTYTEPKWGDKVNLGSVTISVTPRVFLEKGEREDMYLYLLKQFNATNLKEIRDTIKTLPIKNIALYSRDDDEMLYVSADF